MKVLNQNFLELFRINGWHMAVTYERDLRKGAQLKIAASDFFSELFWPLWQDSLCKWLQDTSVCWQEKQIGFECLIYCKPQGNRKMLRLGVAVLLDTINKAAFMAIFHFTFNAEIQMRAPLQSTGCFLLLSLHSTSNFHYYICVC